MNVGERVSFSRYPSLLGFASLALLAAVSLAIIPPVWAADPAPGDAGAEGEIFKVGQKPPAFELTDLKGQKVSLESLKGKTVLLNFWATWCVPCVAEMPALERLSKMLAPEGLVILAVNVDSPEKNDDVKKFIEQNGITFQILRDSDFGAPQQYGLTGFPESFFISPSGEFLDFKDPIGKTHGLRVVGDRPWDSPVMVQAVRDLVKGKK